MKIFVVIRTLLAKKIYYRTRYDLHFSSGFAPQILQAPPSFCNNGLLLLHVPENLPFFFTNILMAIPANARARSTIEINTVAITKCTKF